MINNLTKTILERGGSIHFLKIPAEQTMGLGICNPSVYKDGDELLVNLRNVEYVLYHSENEQNFPTRWGPLAYIHPEDDARLKTTNFLCKLDPETFDIVNFSKVDTSLLDVPPIWTFVGLEDARVIRWEDKLYLSGVRRDTTTNGEGRMELSEIENNRETSRVRINPPIFSYCEKNWMPIVDMPFHYVKWCNPTEVVKVDLATGTSERVILNNNTFSFVRDPRGGSQVIPYKGYRIALIHEVELYKDEGGFKDAQYYHRFLVWDKDWNMVATSEDFKFFTSNIEFGCGLTEHNGELLVSVGYQDNSAYLIRIPGDYFDELIGINNKLSGFPHTYFINYEEHTERRKNVEKELEDYGINYTPFITTKEQDENSVVYGTYLKNLDNHGKYIALSHLRAIKHWYNNTNEPFGVFVEDDVSFEPSKYWYFNWTSFVKNLPKDWDCVQMCRIREHETEVNFRRRLWDDWAATAYMITRKYAKKLIESYYQDDEFLLEIQGTNLMPIIENLIYVPGNTYSFPMLIEKPTAKSSHQLKPDANSPMELMNYIESWHNASSSIILNWWKNNKQKNINSIHPLLKAFIFNPLDGAAILQLAEYYFVQQHYASALGLFLRAAEWCTETDIKYEGLIKVARCLSKLGRRPASEETAYLNAITFQPQRPEAYLFISQYYEYHKRWAEAYTYAAIGLANIKNKKQNITSIDYSGDHVFLYQLGITSNRQGRIAESRKWFFDLADNHAGKLVGFYRNVVQDAITKLGGQRTTDGRYTPLKYKQMRYKFDGLEKVTRNYSQVYQDLFVLSMLNGKREGTYLEIGSADPYINSNTALLEKDFNWKGLSIELKEDEVEKFRKERSNPVLNTNALDVNYEEVLKEHNFSENIDYLQVDCEPPKTTYEILTKLPFDKYKFAVITFEHDNYASLDKIYKDKSRRFLISKGYELIASNIGDFEDWWVNPELINPSIIEIMKDTSDTVKDPVKYMLNLL